MGDLDSRFLIYSVRHIAELHTAFRHNIFCRVASIIEHRIVDTLQATAEARLDPRLLAVRARNGGADMRVVQIRAGM